MKKLSDSRILLVDDAKENLDILVEGLKSDYKLSLAFNGEMALAAVARKPPDLILLDIVMPGMDGYEVCRRLRQLPETADVPIMFLSSLEDVQNKARGFELGANDYVTKPFEMLEVKARVRSLLKSKAYNDDAKEQMASELRIAREIQMGMLPRDFSAINEMYGVDMDAALLPAREVGGDLYGVCPCGPDRLVLFLGDVSGKGIPASMFMVRAISLARLLAREVPEPERILAKLNDELAADNPRGMFVTLLCASFETQSRRIIFANAGHCRPLIVSTSAPPRWAVPNLGVALGFEPGMEFERTEVELADGDALIIYSDGVTEAFRRNNEPYGTKRLMADAAQFAGQSAEALTDGLLTKVHEFAESAPQSDDIAILTLLNKDTASKPDLSLELHATPEEVMRSVEALRDLGQKNGFTEAEVFPLTLALEECASNVVNHALQRDPQQTFLVSIGHSARTITIELRDSGPPFDPTATPRRSPRARDSDLPGGWGIQLVRHYMDRIDYKRDAGQNVLRLARRLDRSTNPQNFEPINQ